jgi:hypothetical protein
MKSKKSIDSGLVVVILALVSWKFLFTSVSGKVNLETAKFQTIH